MTFAKKSFILILFLAALAIIAIDGHLHSKTDQIQTPQALSKTLPDFSQYTDVKAKKTAFFDYMLPFVEQANNEILAERTLIAAIDFQTPTPKQQTQLTALMKKYRVTDKIITTKTKQKLLEKVDIIAPSLALAQAANESSWGTSRFAQKAYNFYGQWCFTEGCGLVPKNRTAGMKHEVKTFKTPYDSVKGYMLNLNSHPYFKPLRDQRLLARQNNQLPTGLDLAKGLIRYSERKEAYIKEISAMIRSNKLTILDS